MRPTQAVTYRRAEYFDRAFQAVLRNIPDQDLAHRWHRFKCQNSTAAASRYQAVEAGVGTNVHDQAVGARNRVQEDPGSGASKASQPSRSACSNT